MTNVPNQIQLLTSHLPDDPSAIMTLHDMRCLQVAYHNTPEAAFLLRTNHLTNILLSRLALDSSLLQPFDHWPYPSDSGYLNIHRRASKASRAIQCAHELMFLAAHCSLAIALWVKGPSSRHSWVFYLERRGYHRLGSTHCSNLSSRNSHMAFKLDRSALVASLRAP